MKADFGDLNKLVRLLNERRAVNGRPEAENDALRKRVAELEKTMRQIAGSNHSPSQMHRLAEAALAAKEITDED